ncbi:hypothetical protein LTR62_005206 [Meristemomyces frigidus]|uniref:Piwi-domain-containing protein n=1 Tax=Meristemomyces frigidus TaxID=1508187 RepID=A0AAN7YFK9_9PEZI|nr:hypothetical protein LTR62_005206 [Meristemomyces frigidus]
MSGEQRDRAGGRGGGGRGGGVGGRGGGPQRSGGRGDRRGYAAPRGGGSGPQSMPYRPGPANVGGIYLDGAPVPAPSQAITKAEDALVLATRGKSFPLGDATVPGRRGYGTKGQSIVLRTNYFAIATTSEENKPDVPWYKYEVKDSHSTKNSPDGRDIDLSRQKKRQLFQAILALAVFQGVTCATDYAKIIITNKKLDLGPGDVFKSKVVAAPVDPPTTQAGPPPDFVTQARERNSVTIAIRLSGTFTTRQIVEYLKSTAPGAEYNTGDIIQLMNIIVCKAPNDGNNVRDAGLNRFYMHEGHPAVEMYNLERGLEALRGYYASVRPAVGRLLLNLNVTSGAFYKPVALRDLLREYGGTNDDKESFIHRLKVTATYQKDGEKTPFMTKTKTIVGFSKPPRTAPRSVVRIGNAKQVSFSYMDHTQANPQPRQVTAFEYFRDHHKITLQAPDLPVLNVGTPNDPQYLPVELCKIIPGQPYRKLLSGNQTSEMLRFAARFPNQNAMSIAGTAQNPGNGLRLFKLRGLQGTDPQAESIKPWGFNTGVEMLTVPGRILQNPQIKYGANKSENPRNGSWNLVGSKFHKPGRFESWGVLVINIGNRNTMFGNPEPLFSELARHLKDYGVAMGARKNTRTIALDPLTRQNRASNDLKIKQEFDSASQNGCPMLLVVLPEVDRWLYARIKLYGDVKYGVHTINAVGAKIQKENGQGMYLGNLALKFNIKGGGVSHVIPNALGKPLDNNTMIFGIDVTHPSPGSAESAPSISCVVASIDEHLTQWPGSIRTQPARLEIGATPVTGLDVMVTERLKLWQDKHRGALPTKIILYRDGVSESQYEQVLTLELPAFHKAFGVLYGAPAKWPKMAIMVVGKRHHTRFYPTREQDADFNPQKQKGSYNPKPGTIVDRHISGRILGEFWLQAHQGLQGTARPAHYVVLKDDIGFEADELQTFTHNMCYLFNRATKAVSICPPAYYADLLCDRGRAYLFSELGEDNGTFSSGVTGAGQTAREWNGGVHPRLRNSTWYI